MNEGFSSFNVMVGIYTTTIEENIIKKLKKLAVDHNTDADRMIEKLFKDYLKSSRPIFPNRTKKILFLPLVEQITNKNLSI